MFEISTAVCGARGAGQDRIAVLEMEKTRVLLAVDGAGGISGGAEAAELVARLVTEQASRCAQSQRASDWEQFLIDVDLALERDPLAGQAAAVVVAIREGVLLGASVGDCEAWLSTERGWQSLTRRQNSKPFLGSGCARPVGFGPVRFAGRLVMGSDGLFKYASREDFLGEALLPVATAAEALVELVRLPSGKLQDDICAIVCEGSEPAGGGWLQRLIGRR